MKLSRQTLINALDARIAEDQAKIDGKNAEIRQANAEKMADYEDPRVRLAAAAKVFARKVSAKTFDGDTRQAETDALVSNGFRANWGESRFHQHGAPVLAAELAHDSELPSLRALLDAVPEEYVTVSALERAGFKSNRLSPMFRSLYRQQQLGSAA